MTEGVLHIAQAVSSLTPAANVLVSLVAEIYACIKASKRNRQQCQTLGDFCNSVVELVNADLSEIDALAPSSEREARLASTEVVMQKLHRALQETLVEITKISGYGLFNSLLNTDSIEKTITDRRVAVADCVNLFTVSSQLELRRWAAVFGTASREDHIQLLNAIRQQKPDGEFVREQPVPLHREVRLQTDTLDDTLRLLQLRLRMYDRNSTQYAAIETTLRELQQRAGDPLLPLADLDGEASKIGNAPVHTSPTTDIWRGIWLGDKDTVVALKCLRAQIPQQSIKVVRRFHSQIELIRRVQHERIILLYGVCYVDGPRPYLVFPWMKHGDIQAYFKEFPNADRTRLMLDVAEGVSYLHAQDPPMVHRALEPGNILVDDNHRAIVTGFGLAKALESLDGQIAYSQSDGLQTSMRWLAPELGATGTCGAPADVYSWAMMTLWALSGYEPFYLVTTPVQIVVAVQKGERPLRAEFPEGSFTNEIWALLESCWRPEPTERPSMAQVVTRIATPTPTVEESKEESVLQSAN